MLFKNAQTNSLSRGLHALDVQKDEVVLVLITEQTTLNVYEIIEFFNERNITFFGGVLSNSFFDNKKLEGGCILDKFKAAAPPFIIRGISDRILDGIAPLSVLKSSKKYTAISLVDGQSSNIDSYVAILNKKMDSYVNLLGSNQENQYMSGNRCLFTNDGFFEDAAICCIVQSKPELPSAHGWKKYANLVPATQKRNEYYQLYDWDKMQGKGHSGNRLSSLVDISETVKILQDELHNRSSVDGATKKRLISYLHQITESLMSKKKKSIFEKTIKPGNRFSEYMIGDSKTMQRVFRLVEKAVGSNITVSMVGDTGTGKEVVAQTIHKFSERKHGPFVGVNMGAIPKNLLESELFGYEKGAFTGAANRKKGQFELANGGTLFLDEIAELDMNMQAKLLRALQEREVLRVGGEKPIPFNARIIIATHKDLKEEVKEGRFREDLYYRLLGLNIHLPPLRERGDDVLLLAQYFLDNYTNENGMGRISFSEEGKQKLLQHTYPGNIRELKAIVELSAVMASDGVVEAEDIQFHSIQKESVFTEQELTMDEYKNRIIKHYLEKYDNDVILVANKLSIGKSTIYRMLKTKELQIAC